MFRCSKCMSCCTALTAVVAMAISSTWVQAKPELPSAGEKLPMKGSGATLPDMTPRGGDPPDCDGDANGDGDIDPLDAGFVQARFGGNLNELDVCYADVNCDGEVDPLDYGYVLARFGTCGPVVDCQLACSPPNDDCGRTASIECGSTTVVDNSSATEDASDPLYSCKFGGADIGFGTLWYSFVADASAATVSTCASLGSPDTLVAVYEGDCDSLTELGCNDDFGCGAIGFNSEVTVTDLVVGNTYIVQVSAWEPAAVGEITLDLTCEEPTTGACCNGGDECTDDISFVECTGGGGAYQGDGSLCAGSCSPPANDSCASAVVIFDGSTPFDNTDATDDGPADCTGDTGHQDLWFDYVVTGGTGGALRVSLCSDTNYDSTLSVYSGAGCPVGDPLGCADDSCGDPVQVGGPSEVVIGLDLIDVGDTLKIRVGGWNNISDVANPSGTGTITIDYVTGGDCCVAHDEPGCDTIDVEGEDAALVEACVCGFDSFCCDVTWDDACVVIVEDICGVDCPLCPSIGTNDECECAEPVVCGGSYTVDIADYSGGGEFVSTCEIEVGGPFSKDASWWYVHTTGPDQTLLHLDFCDTPNEPMTHDTVVTIFTADSTCGGFAELDCGEDECTFPAFGPSDVCTVVAPNTTYLILVDHYSGECGPGEAGCFYTMNVECDDACSP